MSRDLPPTRFSDVSREAGHWLPAVGTREHDLLLADYRPWREVRPIARDLGLTPEAAWATVKRSRLSAWRSLAPLRAMTGSPFGICIGPHLLAPLHRIDRSTGGGGPAALSPTTGDLADPDVRTRLRIQSLMDEAAESSLIEGAATTRKEAVALLRAGRHPVSTGERMVVNNYLAMQHIKQQLHAPLTPERLLELQAMLTRDTLERSDECGRFRRPDEHVRVDDERTGETIFTPPPAAELPDRLNALCALANADHTQGPGFLHPIVKACILHFMIGYEHPFCAGNGRTARAVFYWFALRNDYAILEYAAISEIIRKDCARYPQACLDSELDDGDLTYFVLYKLEVIEQAMNRFAEHLRDSQDRIERSRAFLRVAKDINLRQRLLLEHALRHPLTRYTVKSHANTSGVVLATARADLEDLVRRKLLVTSKDRKQVIYTAAPDLERRLTPRR